MKSDDVKKLQHKKHREQLQHFLVEGEHLILELLRAARTQPRLALTELFITEQYRTWVDEHNTLGFKVTEVGHKTMSQMSDTHTPQGIIAVVPLLPPQPPAHEIAVYLHEIQDPGNLGTILRTLAWLGGFRCLLSSGSVDPYNPKVVRSSMGAIFHLPFEQDISFAEVQQRYPRIAYLDMQGQSVKHPSFSAFDCYAFGNEARGVPHDLLDQAQATPFTISGTGVIESLNLAQAVGMSMFQLAGSRPA